MSSAVKWLQRWHESKSAAPKPRGGSISPLEEFAEQILDLIAQQPDLTLVETVAKLRKRRIRTSRSSLWRFFWRFFDRIRLSPELYTDYSDRLLVEVFVYTLYLHETGGEMP